MSVKMNDIIARVTSQKSYSNLLAGDKFGFLSAKQYGAVGDGVTDDSAAILDMLTAASASTHKALYFPTGVYNVDGVTLTSTHFSGYNCFGDNASFTGITKEIEQVGGGIVSKLTAPGDMLYATTANTIAVLPVSASSKGDIMQTMNGLPSWQPKINTLVYSTAGTYTFTPPISGIYEVTLTGGGGGGGMTAYNATGGVGGGGGAGGTVIATLLLSSSESISVTVGSSGTKGVPGTSNGNGTNGGQSAFGTYFYADYGRGGQGGTTSAFASGGATIATTSLLLSIQRIYGGYGMECNTTQADNKYKLGGISFFGQFAPGGGGLGAYSTHAQSAYGDGLAGCCIIKY